MEYKKLQTVFKEVNQDGTIRAIVSVFGNVDLAGETVLFGAFAKSLKAKLPKGVWMHQWDKTIAITTDAIELEAGDARLPDSIKQYGGLLIEGKFNLELTPANTPANVDAYRAWSDLKFGAIDEFSIGYEVKQSDVKDGVRQLNEVELFEWSPVLVGANRATALIGIKSLGFNEHITAAGEAVRDAFNRVMERSEVRTKAGAELSKANLDAIYTTAVGIREYADGLMALHDRVTAKSEKTLTEQEQTNALARIKIMNLKHKGLIK